MKTANIKEELPKFKKIKINTIDKNWNVNLFTYNKINDIKNFFYKFCEEGNLIK